MSLFIKQAGHLPTFEKALFRNLVALIVATIMLARTEEGFRVKKGSGFGLLMRALCGTLGLLCNFYAIDRLGLADANILNKMAPFFAMIVSAFIIGEKPNHIEVLCVILAFVGAVFVIKPSAGFAASFPAFMGLLGGLGAGTVIVTDSGSDPDALLIPVGDRLWLRTDASAEALRDAFARAALV